MRGKTVQYPINQWKAEARPYCVRFTRKDGVAVALRGRRFATTREALDYAKKSDAGAGQFLLIDYASALAR